MEGGADPHADDAAALPLRRAVRADVPALRALLEEAVRGLSAPWYAPAQVERALRDVLGVDTQLIDDGTYLVIEDARGIVAAGGWSGRHTLYGGDQAKTGADAPLDPAVAPARLRAFFVHPRRARQGLARRLYAACRDAARAAGFRSMELVATLPGVPLYRALGFAVHEELAVPLADGLALPCVRMTRAIDAPAPGVHDAG